MKSCAFWIVCHFKTEQCFPFASAGKVIVFIVLAGSCATAA